MEYSPYHTAHIADIVPIDPFMHRNIWGRIILQGNEIRIAIMDTVEHLGIDDIVGILQKLEGEIVDGNRLPVESGRIYDVIAWMIGGRLCMPRGSFDALVHTVEHDTHRRLTLVASNILQIVEDK